MFEHSDRSEESHPSGGDSISQSGSSDSPDNLELRELRDVCPVCATYCIEHILYSYFPITLRNLKRETSVLCTEYVLKYSDFRRVLCEL
jgi:hypothetical protein